MQSRVDRAFEEWTNGLGPREARIAIFSHVRDIPYSLEVQMDDPETAPEQILELKKGSCGPKHFLLAEMYRILGLEVVFVTVPFLWNDPDIQYPPSLHQLAEALPVAHHLACRVRINFRWILVDATWDPPLKRGGFPITENWDGHSDTACAVKPLYRNYNGGYENIRGRRERAGTGTTGNSDLIRRFNREFDEWLVRIRST